MAQKYCDEVANPMEMILFRKIKKGEKIKTTVNDGFDELDDISELFQGDVNKIFLVFVRHWIDFLFYI